MPIDDTVTKIRKKFGEGSIFKLSSAPLDIDSISTGSLTLDIALGVGGLPRGRVVEIYGPESSGKSTICQQVIANAQKEGLSCVFIDMEHALDPSYAAALGVDLEDLYVSQPDTGEQALEIAEYAITGGDVGVVVIDSVSALVPRAELEGDMGDAHVGLQARLMSQALRKLSGAVKNNNVLLIFTNQIRHKIGVMFGSPETTSGGNALKFYASVRLDIRRIGSIKDRGDVVGNRTRVRVKKNKVAPPFKEAEFDLIFGEGVSKEGEILDLGVDLDVIKKSGAYFYYPYDSDQKWHGKQNAVTSLKEKPEIADEIADEIVEALDKKKKK